VDGNDDGADVGRGASVVGTPRRDLRDFVAAFASVDRIEQTDATRQSAPSPAATDRAREFETDWWEESMALISSTTRRSTSVRGREAMVVFRVEFSESLFPLEFGAAVRLPLSNRHFLQKGYGSIKTFRAMRRCTYAACGNNSLNMSFAPEATNFFSGAPVCTSCWHVQICDLMLDGWPRFRFRAARQFRGRRELANAD
jgi:hypothetical protein